MINKKSIINKSVKIGKNVIIENFSIIGDNVEIGDNTYVGSHTKIVGPTKIGNNNKIFQFCSIGEDSQLKNNKLEKKNGKLLIGDNNTFREGVIIHRGSELDKGLTFIGNNNLFMANSHVAHDCIVNNNTIFSNYASISGHVNIKNNVNLGGMVGIHQFCSIGEYSFISGGSIILKDVIPYSLISGSPSKIYGLNYVGLKRNKFSNEDVYYLKNSYKLIYNTSYIMKDIIKHLSLMKNNCKKIGLIIDFIKKSKRGIIR